MGSSSSSIRAGKSGRLGRPGRSVHHCVSSYRISYLEGLKLRARDKIVPKFSDTVHGCGG
jgi:hypothetical protein